MDSISMGNSLYITHCQGSAQLYAVLSIYEGDGGTVLIHIVDNDCWNAEASHEYLKQLKIIWWDGTNVKENREFGIWIG